MICMGKNFQPKIFAADVVASPSRMVNVPSPLSLTVIGARGLTLGSPSVARLKKLYAL